MSTDYSHERYGAMVDAEDYAGTDDIGSTPGLNPGISPFYCFHHVSTL